MLMLSDRKRLSATHPSFSAAAASLNPAGHSDDLWALSHCLTSHLASSNESYIDRVNTNGSVGGGLDVYSAALLTFGSCRKMFICIQVQRRDKQSAAGGLI